MLQVPVVGGLAVVAGVTLVWKGIPRRRVGVTPSSPNERKNYWTQAHSLLALESSVTGLGISAVTTITSFTGASADGKLRQWQFVND